jgi:autotransporter-associated beta strand protein
LTLTGNNTYTGVTRVLGGALSITQPYLADAADVFVAGGATLNLNTSGAVDVIDSLFLSGMSQAAGVYGAVGSGAQFETAFLTGSGRLQVQTFVLQGDFDLNLVVDAADLDVWRGAFGTTAAGDADLDGDTDGNDFVIWQRNLGRTSPGTAVAAAVPEPGAAALAAGTMVAVVAARRRRRTH